MTTEEETVTDVQPFSDKDAAEDEASVLRIAARMLGKAQVDRGRLEDELGRVQEAYDRAKPVLDAARAWRKDVYEERAFGEDSGEWIHVAEDALAAAVDAYDTAQKAPDQ